MGGSSGSQQQQTSQQSSPWAPTQPMLENIISNLGGFNYAPTAQQQSGVQSLQSGANAIPNFGPQAANTANSFLSGIGNPNQNLYGSLSGITNPANLNPMSNPYTGQALQTMNQDITNQINGQFAGAGRDLSPANTTALARGLSQGEGGLLMGQYNTNVGNLVGAAQGLNSGLQGNAQMGLGAAGGTAGQYTAPGQAQLGAANAGYQLPLSNVGGLEGLTLPIAGLGGQTQGTSNMQTQQQLSPIAMAFGGAGAFNNFLNPFAGFGGQKSGIGGLSSFLGL